MTTPRRGRHALPSIVDTGELAVTQPGIPPVRAQLADDVDQAETDYDDTEDEDMDDDPELEPEAPPASSGKVESKVIASTAGSFVISTALAQLNGMSDAQILDGLGLNPTVQFLVILFLPPIITFASGWLTRSNRG